MITAAALLLALVASPPPTGHWEGAFSRDGAIQTIRVDLTVKDGKPVGTYDMDELGVLGDPLEEVTWNPPVLSFKMRYGTFPMILHEEAGEMTGINTKWGPPLSLHLKRTLRDLRPQVPREDVTFSNGTVKLAGTLYKPFGEGPWPVIVVVSGSGALGRAYPNYNVWGRFFAEHGYAALVYDKRGVGESTGDWERSTFSDLANDAVSAVELLAKRKDIDQTRIGLMGISQGGWLSPLAATRTKHIAFLILDVGAAVTTEQQELDRILYSMKDEEQSEADIADAVAYTKAVFDAAYRGADTAALIARAPSLKAKPWVNYVQLIEKPEDLEGWRLSNYDPAPVLKKTTLPILSIFGERDVLVPPADNKPLMEQYLKEAGNKDVTIRVIPRAAHNMEMYRTLEGGAWQWPEKFWVWSRKSPLFYETILEWLDARVARARPKLVSN